MGAPRTWSDDRRSIRSGPGHRNATFAWADGRSKRIASTPIHNLQRPSTRRAPCESIGSSGFPRPRQMTSRRHRLGRLMPAIRALGNELGIYAFQTERRHALSFVSHALTLVARHELRAEDWTLRRRAWVVAKRRQPQQSKDRLKGAEGRTMTGSVKRQFSKRSAQGV